jgi:hypothetical protein
MGFRMTDSPFPRISPNALDTDVDAIRLYDTSRAFQCTVSNPRSRPRPSPLPILRERLFLNSGSNRTFGYPRHAPSLTASDGLALLNRAWDFRSDLVRMAEVFFWKRGNRRVPKGGPLIPLFETPECAPLRVMSLNHISEVVPVGNLIRLASEAESRNVSIL